MTNELRDELAKVLFESRYPFSWNIASKRTLNENLYAEAEQCRKDAQAVIDHITPMMKEVVGALDNIKYLTSYCVVQCDEVDDLYDNLEKALASLPACWREKEATHD
jgi:hypothetical protein